MSAKKETAKAVSFTFSSCLESEQGNRFVIHGIDVIGAAGRDQLDQAASAALNVI